MITTNDIITQLVGYLLISLLPVWIGYRRKVALLPMLFIVTLPVLIPFLGLVTSFYVVCRAKSRVPEIEKISTGL